MIAFTSMRSERTTPCAVLEWNCITSRAKAVSERTAKINDPETAAAGAPVAIGIAVHQYLDRMGIYDGVGRDGRETAGAKPRHEARGESDAVRSEAALAATQTAEFGVSQP